MDVLVIGGTGPSGTPLVQELLNRGYRVTIYHSGAHEAEWADKVEHIHGDTWGEGPMRNLAKRQWDMAINTYGRSEDIVSALKGGKIGKLVSVTGHGVYKNIHCKWPHELGLPIPIRESMPVKDAADEPRFYKIAQGERAIMQARDEGHFKACIFRYPRVYGPHINPALAFDWYWIKRIMDGRRRVLLPGYGLSAPQRGFGPNFAHMLLLGLESEKSDGQIYNACDSVVLTLSMITTLFAEALGHEWELIPVPFAIAPMGNPYAFYSHTLLDTSKARYELGYHDVVHPIEATKIGARWHMERPLNDEEQRANTLYEINAFDYDKEDEIIDKYQSFVQQFPPPEVRTRGGW
ncbi:hypothetical protein ACFLXT_03740 [Chloroflexota bacterium]